MPYSAIVTSMDPDEYRQSLRDQVKLVITARGEFGGAVTRVDLHRLRLQRYQESLPRIFHTTVSSSRTVIVYPANAQQAPKYHTGMEVPPGHIVYRSLGSEHHFRSSVASHWGAVSFAPEDLVAAGEAIADRDLTPPKTNQLIRPSPVLMDRLLHLHAAANNLAVTAPYILAHPEIAKAIEQH